MLEKSSSALLDGLKHPFVSTGSTAEVWSFHR